MSAGGEHRPIDAELLDAIRSGDIRRIRLAISYGADPNGSIDGDSFLKNVFELSSHEKRMAVLECMVQLGANPGSVVRQDALLYVASFTMNDEEMRFLLDRGANPNAATDDQETTYDMIEFDYRYDLWGLTLPIKPVGADRVSEANWLNFLDRCADTSRKPRPEHLRLLRQYGALRWSERKNRRVSRNNAGILHAIVSCGETEAERAALDWAADEGIKHVGRRPEVCKFEDGTVPERHNLTDLALADHVDIKQNIIDSEGTLFVNLGALDNGARATLRLAEQLKRPCLVTHAESVRRANQAEELNHWLHEHKIVTLNVAGDHENRRLGVYDATYDLFCALLGCRFIGMQDENSE